MKKKPRKKAEPKSETPLTYQEAARAKGWGQGDRAMPQADFEAKADQLLAEANAALMALEMMRTARKTEA